MFASFILSCNFSIKNGEYPGRISCRCNLSHVFINLIQNHVLACFENKALLGNKYRWNSIVTA